jgi:hypothetical protein
MEITTTWKDEFIPIPACPCPHQAIVKLNAQILPGSIYASYHSDMPDSITTPLIKINSNPVI